MDALLSDCRERVRNLLLKKRHVVEGVRDALLEREELVGDEIEVLMAELGEREPIEVPVTGNGGRSPFGVPDGPSGNGRVATVARRTAGTVPRRRDPTPAPLTTSASGSPGNGCYASNVVRLFDSLTRQVPRSPPWTGRP